MNFHTSKIITNAAEIRRTGIPTANPMLTGLELPFPKSFFFVLNEI